jgi:SulP family sulfate permease
VNSSLSKPSLFQFISNRFPLSNLRGDIAGGISAGIVAIPLALAFGAQSGLGAVAGLYSAIALGLFASAFGGTPTQISGPTGPMVVIAAMVVADALEGAGGLVGGMPVIIATFVLAGIFQLIFGILKLGKYIRYIPYPVISGFMSGIGVIIILYQIFPIMGQASPKGIYNIFTHLPQAFLNFDMEATILGVVTIATIYAFPKITRSIPNILVALTAVSLMAIWTEFDVEVIGAIPSQLPEFKLSLLSQLSVMDIQPLFIPAITLALLGSIDSLLTSVIADNVTKTKHDSNQELMGQGIGNILSASIGGIPGAGTTMSTLVNTNSGATSRMSGIVHGISLILVLLLAGSLAGQIPIAVLSGILITVGIGIIDYKGLKHLKKMPREETAVMLMVLLMTVFADLIQAVAVGMFFSSFLFMKKMGDLVEGDTEIMPINEFKSSEQFAGDETVCFTPEFAKTIFVKKLHGPLFFGFASAFQDIARKLKNIRIVILKMNSVPYIDQTGLYAMEEVIMDLKKRGVAVCIAGLQEQPHDMLMKIDLIPSLIPEEFLFQNFSECASFLGANKHLRILEREEY